MESFLFYILASIAVVSSLVVILAKKIVHSAIWLIVTLLSLSAIYVLLYAEFLAALQVLIYAGAVIVLILFAVFIINQEKDEYEMKWHLQTPLAYLLGGMILLELFFFIGKTVFENNGVEKISLLNKIGNTEAVAVELFSKYILPFEIVSVLLLASMVGAVFIARKEKE